MTTDTTRFQHVTYDWDDDAAARLDPVARLVYRSNLLGADQRITNTGGGNTSAKLTAPDPLTGQPVRVLWVKGSGGDLRTSVLANFASLYQDRLMQLQDVYAGMGARGVKSPAEDHMVGLYPHCTFNLNPRATSIDTPLHAFVPAAHVDHMHPNAVISVAASRHSERLTREIYGDDVVWTAWQRPGFELGLVLQDVVQRHPQAHGVILGQHGLINWADEDKACYDLTLSLITKAAAYIEALDKGEATFGGQKYPDIPAEQREAVLLEILPWLRGQVSASAKPSPDSSAQKRMIATLQHDATILRFVNSHDAPRLAELGTSCPDHFLRTKVKPMVLDVAPGASMDKVRERVAELHEAYRADYAAYYDRNATEDSPAMRGADPLIVLVPGIGMFSYGKDKQTARVAGEFYVNAINVMRGAEGLSTYAPIDESEKFRIEYWALEEAKLQRMPKPKPLASRIALVTGAASGIGLATARKLAAEGACVVIADLSLEKAQAAAAEIGSTDVAVGVQVDVSDAAAVQAAVDATVLAFGGVDLVVNNAGLSLSRSLLDTTEKDWDLQHDVMAKGSFLVAQAAAKAMIDQGIGGDIVYISSKNSIFAGPNNVAYGAAKADQAHQVRLLAAELGEHGIKVNGVNPDGVVQGSGIFSSGWGASRAAVYGVEEKDLGKFYAQRTLLKREVLPDNIANAVFVLCSDQLSHTTGLHIPVDAGVAAAFLR
jgi:rhamnulose-1-phosphate aldolase/alcohol dehydrogenase